MEICTITPLIELPAESISFELQETKLTRSHGAVAARGVNVSDGRINYCRFGGAADLRKIGKESGKVLEEYIVRNCRWGYVGQN
jgi:hypothetical protein